MYTTLELKVNYLRAITLDTGPVRNWTLDGNGFDGLLSRLEELLAKSGLPKHFVAGRARHPLNVRQRLSLQHAIAKAEFLAKGR